MLYLRLPVRPDIPDNCVVIRLRLMTCGELTKYFVVFGASSEVITRSVMTTLPLLVYRKVTDAGLAKAAGILR